MLNRKLSASLSVIAIAFLLASATQALVGSSQSRGSAAPPPGPFVAREGSFTRPVGNGVWVEQTFSLLPAIVLQDGTSVRPVRINALYLSDNMRLVGQSLFHRLVPVGSTESFDLSIDDLEISSAEGAAGVRSCSVHATPAAGKSWGTIDNVREQVVVTAAPKTH